MRSYVLHLCPGSSRAYDQVVAQIAKTFGQMIQLN